MPVDFQCVCLRVSVFSLIVCRFSKGFRDSQDVLAVLEGPRRALRVLGSSLGRFVSSRGDLGRSQGGVQSLLLGGEYVTKVHTLELGRFSVTCGTRLELLFVFQCFVEGGFC